MSRLGALRVQCVAAALLLFPVAAAPPAAAQSAANTSGIEGKVTDESGAVLPGVSVTISSPSLQSPRLEAITNDDGRYRFSDLPAGVFDITYALSGFQTITHSGLRLAANFIATRDVKLGVGQVEETVTVAGASPVVDVRTTAAVSNIRSEVVENIPTSRSYEEMAKLAPGVRVSGIPDVGGNKTGGGRGTLVNYGSSAGGSTLMLDGINTDGTAGYYDAGAIEEMIVRAAGSDPEIATPGMAFQVIVKSGGNDFHGEGLYAAQTRGLQSSNIDDGLRAKGVTGGNPMDRYYDLNGSIGGRILRDRIWFFGSARRKEYRAELINFSGGPGSDGVYFTPDDEGGLTADRESNLVGKVTTKLSRAQGLSWMHHYDYKKQDNRGGSAFIPHEAAGNYELPNSVYRFEYTNTLSNRSFLRATIGRSWWLSNAVPYTDNPPSFDQVTQRRLGAYINSVGSDSTPAGSLASRYQYDVAYSYYRPGFLKGDHDFKVGFNYNSEVYNKFQKARGEGTGGAGNDYLLTFNNGTPVEVLLYNSPFDSKNTVHYVGGYFRDSWRAGDRLTINAGVRVERYKAFLPEQSKPAGPFSEAADYPKTDLYEWSGVAPRIGLSYALTSDNRTAIKFAYGRFNFALRASDSRTIRNFNKNDYSATRYRWNDLNGNRRLDYPQELGDFLAREGGSTTVFNPDIQQPMTEELTLHLQREIAGGVAARVGYVYKRENDLFQLVNTARPYDVYNIPITVTDPGPDGAAGSGDDGKAVTYYDFDPAYRGPAFEKFTYINVPGYDDQYHNLEVGLEKRMSNGWQFQGSVLAPKKDKWIAGVPVTPNDEFFPKDQTWETTIRLSGSYQAPWGILASGVYEYQSGAAQARDVLFRTGLRQLANVTLRMEALGASPLDAVQLLNVRLGKRLQIPGAGRVTLSLDLYNALNANTATTVSARSGPTYGRITAILPPRVARLGMTYAF